MKHAKSEQSENPLAGGNADSQNEIGADEGSQRESAERELAAGGAPEENETPSPDLADAEITKRGQKKFNELAIDNADAQIWRITQTIRQADERLRLEARKLELLEENVTRSAKGKRGKVEKRPEDYGPEEDAKLQKVRELMFGEDAV